MCICDDLARICFAVLRNLLQGGIVVPGSGLHRQQSIHLSMQQRLTAICLLCQSTCNLTPSEPSNSKVHAKLQPRIFEPCDGAGRCMQP